jgi:hypothetical protein
VLNVFEVAFVDVEFTNVLAASNHSLFLKTEPQSPKRMIIEDKLKVTLLTVGMCRRFCKAAKYLAKETINPLTRQPPHLARLENS